MNHRTSYTVTISAAAVGVACSAGAVTNATAVAANTIASDGAITTAGGTDVTTFPKH